MHIVSPAHVVEPTYRKLKRELLQGRWPLGFRLEAMRLADDLGVSMTPVRDCLNRLVGERLVDLRPGEGFSVARLNERALRDLLEFNAALLVFALHIGAVRLDLAPCISANECHADQVAGIFEQIARAAGNTVLSETVGALNDRLHAARRLDPLLLDDCRQELEEIAAALGNGEDKERQRALVVAYHDRRQLVVSDTIARLELAGD